MCIRDRAWPWPRPRLGETRLARSAIPEGDALRVTRCALRGALRLRGPPLPLSPTTLRFGPAAPGGATS
eukprot:5609859-Alexandrium_andersonii.AAC.1